MTKQISESVVNFRAFESAEHAVEMAEQVFAISMAKAFPLEISYADYTVARTEWKTAYAGPSDAANDTAFSRALTKMNKYLTRTDAAVFLIPKSPRDTAKTKQAGREAEKAKVSTAAALPAATLAKQALAGDVVAVKALEVQAKAKAKAAKEKANELTKATIAKVKSANPLAQRIAYLSAQGDVPALCALICTDWPVLASAIAAKVSAGGKAKITKGDKVTTK